MRSPIKKLAAVLLVLLMALMLNINYLSVVRGPDLRQQQGNTRLILDEYARERGAILVGGRPVASSIKTKDSLVYLRRYSNGPLYAPVTGYYSSIYGASAIENSENSLLAGSSDLLFGRRLVDLFTGRAPRGGSVVLTIDPRVQAAAANALGSRKGAVVALDPASGAILAMVSSPTFDPNDLSSHQAGDIRKAWTSLVGDQSEPLLNRALSQTYPPGSAFKVITAAAALTSGKFSPSSQVDGPASYKLPGTSTSLRNFDRADCLGGKLSLADALRISCNTAFAKIGISVGTDELSKIARGFGFGTSFSIPMGSAISRFPGQLNAAQTAQSSIGQFDVAATPLQMAMVAAGIANRGKVMRPYLVSERLGPELTVLSRANPEEFGQPISTRVAAQLTSMMVSVVRSGTGQAAQISGVDVAGKTGTAQTAPGKAPHAWFIAFAPAATPRIAVAVLVESGGNLGSEATGGRLAAPIARAVISSLLGS